MNKQSTIEDYRQRISRVVDYIYQHLDEPLDTDKLAEIACFSNYHWHRIYHSMTGETAIQTVRRLRLHRAAFQLLNSDKPISDISSQAAYGSIEAFNRAFRKSYELPPAAFREAKKDLFLEQTFLKGGDIMYDVEIKPFDAVTLAAFSHKGPYLEIGQAFDKLGIWAGAKGLLNEQTRMLGVYYDDPNEVPQEKLRSSAGLVVPDNFEADSDMHIVKLEGGNHAVLHHKGPYAELDKAYHWFFGQWLPNSGHETADRPPFEEYLNDPKTVQPNELLTDVFLPLLG